MTDRGKGVMKAVRSVNATWVTCVWHLAKILPHSINRYDNSIKDWFSLTARDAPAAWTRYSGFLVRSGAGGTANALADLLAHWRRGHIAGCRRGWISSLSESAHAALRKTARLDQTMAGLVHAFPVMARRSYEEGCIAAVCQPGPFTDIAMREIAAEEGQVSLCGLVDSSAGTVEDSGATYIPTDAGCSCGVPNDFGIPCRHMVAVGWTTERRYALISPMWHVSTARQVFTDKPASYSPVTPRRLKCCAELEVRRAMAGHAGDESWWIKLYEVALSSGLILSGGTADDMSS
jgi:hypothetical protein